MEEIKINTEYIKLDQFLKYVDIVQSGAEAKYFISENTIKVNGEVVFQRGKKLRSGDKVDINGKEYIIIH
ncbi:S4 domain-containing protein YaaA [Defluviitalea raffinosedens]|uniref:S4 domain-containing protein YaaA n=1 Tax=Defluviitalea raffinosedens TaxID=1450156 RepID=A0A7C8LJL4_9FIRM|nr:S4 domain-containing protein YaaA [Defluviitalea raffinosedens]KAE9630259.1 S4 domain-containing protein YaaA [Defluviitalea raffinosedens]MBM7686062.1 ribosome-associated protein [Defluviitalea raffinosedens]HHW67691.1 S4 domain-containing protein YaaA [Candidatus Epulonipiscium sp.]